MKRDTLLKSALGLLAIAGACMPISSLAAQSMTSYGEDALYDNLESLHSAPSQSGAQGPIRTESMDQTFLYSEDTP